MVDLDEEIDVGEGLNYSLRHVNMTCNEWPSEENPWNFIPFAAVFRPLQPLVEKPTNVHLLHSVDEQNVKFFMEKKGRLEKRPKFCPSCSAVTNCLPIIVSEKDFSASTKYPDKRDCPFCHETTLQPPDGMMVVDRTISWNVTKPTGVNISRPNPIFVFLVDTSSNGSLGVCRNIIKESIPSLPSQSLVGVVSFNRECTFLTLQRQKFVPPTMVHLLIEKLLSSQSTSRRTGSALRFVSQQVEAKYQTSYCRILAFLSGTRSDMNNDFMDYILQRRQILDVVSCLDKRRHNQLVFDSAIKATVEKSGGVMFQTEPNHLYRCGNSLIKLVKNQTFEASTKIICSEGIKIQKIIGPGKVEEANNVWNWKLNSIDKDTCITIIFKIAPGRKRERFYVQFITRYQKLDGCKMCRVTTLSRKWKDSTSMLEMLNNFDIQTVAVVVTKLLSYKMETEVQFNAKNWLRLAIRYFESKNVDSTNREIGLLLDYFYHINESRFVKAAPHNQNWRAYFAFWLNRENVEECALMFYPQILGCHTKQLKDRIYVTMGPQISSLRKDVVLVMDSYFEAVMSLGAEHNPDMQHEYTIDLFHIGFVRLVPAIRKTKNMPNIENNEALQNLPLVSGRTFRIFYKLLNDEYDAEDDDADTPTPTPTASPMDEEAPTPPILLE